MHYICKVFTNHNCMNTSSKVITKCLQTSVFYLRIEGSITSWNLHYDKLFKKFGFITKEEDMYLQESK
jgi:hypothetical protein